MKFFVSSLLVAGVLAVPATVPTAVSVVVPVPSPIGGASTPSTPPPPTVQLSYGTFQGKVASGINSFLGIPFARPPVGDLRFRRAIVPPLKYTGIQDASKYGPSCTQQQTSAGLLNGIPASLMDQVMAMPAFSPAVSDSEDCLTINVQGPAGIKNGTLLPVVVWIYGGGFEFGKTSGSDGAPIVARSTALGEPIIYVSMNYRLNAFGFLAGAEVKAAGVGNLGLDDQRAALRWVQTNVHLFGGDKTKVTIWGESAGAISVALQMVSNGGNPEGLFRAAFCLSGAPIPVGSILNGQPEFDALAKFVGCTGANKTLACMRLVPYQTLKAGMDQSNGIFAASALKLAWLPRVDGVFLTQGPFNSVENGAYAKVPMITGDCDDEGTLFSITSAPNILTDQQAVDYLRNNYAPNATAEEIANVALLYPSDPTQGSPYGTGLLNQLTPQFKRIASFTGDLVFEGSRRHFLSFASKTQATWSYNFRRLKATPFIGSFHSSEIATQFYLAGKGGVDNEFIDYLVNFVNTLDPNNAANGAVNPGIISWPKWDNTNGAPAMLAFTDRPEGGALGLTIQSDTYRQGPIAYLIKLALKYPF